MEKKKVQIGMFDESNADLPLFSGTPIKEEAPAFVPVAPAARQAALFSRETTPELPAVQSE